VSSKKGRGIRRTLPGHEHHCSCNCSVASQFIQGNARLVVARVIGRTKVMPLSCHSRIAARDDSLTVGLDACEPAVRSTVMMPPGFRVMLGRTEPLQLFVCRESEIVWAVVQKGSKKFFFPDLPGVRILLWGPRMLGGAPEALPGLTTLVDP
jgi:hypothetical protein